MTTMREALERAHDLSLDGRNEEARAVLSEALAVDDAARGTVQEAAAKYCDWGTAPVSAFEAGARWQASRAAAPQTDGEEILASAIRDLVGGRIKCSDDLPVERRPVGAAARRAFGAVYQLKRAAAPQAVSTGPLTDIHGALAAAPQASTRLPGDHPTVGAAMDLMDAAFAAAPQARLTDAEVAAAIAEMASAPQEFDIYLDEESSALLRDTIGEGDASAVRIQFGNGHSGPGLYVSLAEHPEEGSIKLWDSPIAAAPQADDFGRECDDADKILAALGLDPEQCRTDGGSLRVAKIIADLQTPNAALPPLGEGPRREITVTVSVPGDWEQRLDMQWVLEREIRADRWRWNWPAPQSVEPVAWIRHDWSGTGQQHLSFDGPPKERPVRDEVVNPIWKPLYPAPPTDAEWQEEAMRLFECRLADRYPAWRDEIDAKFRAHIATRPLPAPPTKKENGA